MNVALVGTAYERPEYLDLAVASWQRAGVERLPVVVWNLDRSPRTPECAEIVSRLPTHVILVEPRERVGVLAAPWRMGEYGFDTLGADYLIFAEDDVVVSSDALDYLLWAGEAYRDDSTVLAVNAFRNGRNDLHCESPNHVQKVAGFSPLAWATWADRWRDRLSPEWDFDYTHRGWDWNINRLMRERWETEEEGDARVFSPLSRVVSPCRSRSQHIGQQGGIHCTEAMFESTLSVVFEETYTSDGVFCE